MFAHSWLSRAEQKAGAVMGYVLRNPFVQQILPFVGRTEIWLKNGFFSSQVVHEQGLFFEKVKRETLSLSILSPLTCSVVLQIRMMSKEPDLLLEDLVAVLH